jgi:hypothetical protein
VNVLDAILNLLLAAGGLLLNVVYWALGLMVFLHTEMPRLEGLLVGVFFAWLYVHRDKNAFVRAIAAPMKIIIDILDIVWDETIEAVADVYSTVKEFIVQKTVGVKNWIVGGTLSVWSSLMSKLSALRTRLSRKEKE